MKKGTSRHPKVGELARHLKVPRYAALGLLQYLWDFAEDFAPRGDIGRYEDIQIAEHLYWTGDPAELVSGLCQAHWLDPIRRPSGVRLAIHDWAEHCEDSIHRKLARARQFFWDGKAPKLSRLDAKERPAIERWYTDHARDVRTSGGPKSVRTSGGPNAPLPKPKPKPVPEPEPTGAGAAAPNGSVPPPPQPQTRYEPLPDFDPQPHFEALWNTHPGRARHRDCLEKYLEIVVEDRPDPAPIARKVQDSAEAWLAYWKASGRSPTGLFNWLNNGDWEQEPPPVIVGRAREESVWDRVAKER